MEEKVDSRLKLEGDICQILGQVYCNENNSGKEVDAMYCMDASDKIADFILRHTEELRKENEELNKQVGAALGTADHYCKENDRLKALVDDLERIFDQPVDRIIFPINKEDFTLFRNEALAKIAEYKEWCMMPSPR